MALRGLNSALGAVKGAGLAGWGAQAVIRPGWADALPSSNREAMAVSAAPTCRLPMEASLLRQRLLTVDLEIAHCNRRARAGLTAAHAEAIGASRHHALAIRHHAGKIAGAEVEMHHGA